MQIGASVPVELSIGDAAEAIRRGDSPVQWPASRNTDGPDDRRCRRRSDLQGFVVVLRTASSEALEAWLQREDPVSELKAGRSATRPGPGSCRTPDPMLDLTAAPNVLAMDGLLAR